MRRAVLIVVVLALVATGAMLWRDRDTAELRKPAADLAALRLQATDLQRAVETLARSPDPDPAALAALAERLQALNRGLAAIQGQAGD